MKIDDVWRDTFHLNTGYSRMYLLIESERTTGWELSTRS